MFKKLLFLFIPFILITLEGTTFSYSTVHQDYKKVLEQAWLSKDNYIQIKDDLNQILNDTKEIRREKSAIALMLFLKDKEFKDFFEENKPKKLNEFSKVVELLFKHYTPKNEEQYLQILSIVETYPYDNSLDGFFSHYSNSFTFKKFVRKNYYNIALVALNYEKKIDSKNIDECITLANSIYNTDNIRKKVLKLILKKVDIYRSYGDDKYSIDVVDKIVFSLRNEDNLDEYLWILESKLQEFDYDYKHWQYRKDDKHIFNGLLKFLGEKHFFIKAMPTSLKEFYEDNSYRNKKTKIIPIDKQQLVNTHWTENRCHSQTQFDHNGDAHITYFKEIYHFGLDNKIYISDDNYINSKCKVKKDNDSHEYYREYKEIKTVGKSNDLYEIRLDEFNSFAKSFSDFKHKNAFFDFKGNKLCFSKSIFTDEEEKTISDSNGNLFTTQVRGFYIDENKSDEVDYKNCLIKVEHIK